MQYCTGGGSQSISCSLCADQHREIATSINGTTISTTNLKLSHIIFTSLNKIINHNLSFTTAADNDLNP